MKSKLTEEQQIKWLVVVKNEFILPEESGEGDTIVVYPLVRIR